jgi:hypothetical protein
LIKDIDPKEHFFCIVKEDTGMMAVILQLTSAVLETLLKLKVVSMPLLKRQSQNGLCASKQSVVNKLLISNKKNMTTDQCCVVSCEKPLDGAYWDAQYQANSTGWDLGTVSPPIQTYIDTIQNKDLAVLIPGCGIPMKPNIIEKVLRMLPLSTSHPH